MFHRFVNEISLTFNLAPKVDEITENF